MKTIWCEYCVNPAAVDFIDSSLRYVRTHWWQVWRPATAVFPLCLECVSRVIEGHVDIGRLSVTAYDAYTHAPNAPQLSGRMHRWPEEVPERVGWGSR